MGRVPPSKVSPVFRGEGGGGRGEASLGVLGVRGGVTESITQAERVQHLFMFLNFCPL